MSATAAIRALCDVPGKALRDALLVYAKGNSRAPAAIRADAILYGELVRHYLQWSAALLTTMEQAAAVRPACKSAVDRLVELADAYFRDTARWPAAAHLDHPLRLLIPAYYTVRGVQQVNSLLRPELVSVDLAEAHEFVVEILGHGVSQKVSQHKNADLKALTRIADEPPPVAEPLHHRSFLHASQRSRLAEARAPKPAPPPAPAAPPPAPAVTIEKDKPLALGWSLELSDKRIVVERTNSFDSGSYYSRETFLDLARGHRYRLLQTSFSRVSSGGLSIGGPSRKESRGEWKVQVTGDTARLALIDDDGGVRSFVLKKGGRDYVTLDGHDRAWMPL